MKTSVATSFPSFAASAVVLLLTAATGSPKPVSFTQTDDSATFKTETNLVLVPVVVRDANGNEVGNLRKEDFHLFDKGKPQIITKFAVEDTSGQGSGRQKPAECKWAFRQSLGIRAIAITRQLATPETYYVLGFVPDAKPDGHFHQLKVKIDGSRKVTVEARAGYYAPQRTE